MILNDKSPMDSVKTTSIPTKIESSNKQRQKESIFKKFDDLISKELELVAIKLQDANKKINPKNIFDEYCREVGTKFIDVEIRYAITIEELLDISESVAEYVTMTRFTNIDRLLFENGDRRKPRLKKNGSFEYLNRYDDDLVILGIDVAIKDVRVINNK